MTRIWTRVFVLLVVVSFLAVPTPAEGPAQTSKQNQKVLRVTTRLVEVNVVVQDRKGQPVTDLTRDDFLLTEEGRRQEINFFSKITNEPTLTPLKPLPLHTFSNRLDLQAGAPKSVIVILLDALNTEFSDQIYAKNHIVKFLQQIQPQDRVALYVLGSNLRVLHDFTDDTRSLLAALARFSATDAEELKASQPGRPPTSITLITPNLGNAPMGAPAPVQVGLDTYLREAAQRSADFYTVNRALRTLDALQAIANRLSHIKGRKILIWVSGSFPFYTSLGGGDSTNVIRGQQRSLAPDMERAERALNNANLAIYPVDARGLLGPSGVNLNLSAEGSVTARAPGNPTIAEVGQLPPTQDTMEELADRTGGRSFYGNNDLLAAIRRASEDARVTYLLGYYPSHANWDGTFRRIKVKVERQTVRVLCRRGYFAIPERPLDEKARAAMLSEAAANPLDSTAVGLTVHLDDSDRTERSLIPLTVEVDPRDITLTEKDGRWEGSVDFYFVQASPEGRALKVVSQKMRMRLSRERYDEIMKVGLSISGKLSLVRGADHLRVLARDGSSGGLGSVSLALAPGEPLQTQ